MLTVETQAQEVLKLAERIRARIAATTFANVGDITVSIGVAQWQTSDSRRKLIERADQAMYIAKQNGRNQLSANR